MNADIPLTYADIVGEIAEIMDLPRGEVEHRVWMEAVELGWNVARDVERFAVTPNEYDEKMDLLYREGDGFIFETLVFWAKPDRQRWSERAVERMHSYASRIGLEPHEMKTLVLGDGTGNDSLYLAANGFRVDYFEVPGSKTFDFAMRRFERRGVLGRMVNVVSDYRICLSGRYDAVISFEVLEHLPDPPAAIRDMRSMLKDGGIALVTESFGLVFQQFPTHLHTNARYAGRTSFLFLRNKMMLSWYHDPSFRPMEFIALTNLRARTVIPLFQDRKVVVGWIRSRVSDLRRYARNRS